MSRGGNVLDSMVSVNMRVKPSQVKQDRYSPKIENRNLKVS